MKTNIFSYRRCATFVVCILSIFSYSRDWKIVNIAPPNHPKIKIGDKLCGVDSTFNENDTIYWDSTLTNQAIRVCCVKDCSDISGPREKRNCSKLENKRKSGIFLSLKTLMALVSQGDSDEEPIILWPGELILVEGVQKEPGYEYFCRVKGKLRNIPLEQQGEELYLRSDDFVEYGAEFSIQIYKVGGLNSYSSIVKELKVEQCF